MSLQETRELRPEIRALKSEMNFIAETTASHLPSCQCSPCLRFCEIVDVLIYANAFWGE